LHTTAKMLQLNMFFHRLIGSSRACIVKILSDIKQTYIDNECKKVNWNYVECIIRLGMYFASCIRKGNRPV